MPRGAYAPAMKSVRDRHAVQIAGVESSRPMLFAQGFGCDQTMWSKVAPAFERSFKVVTFDYVGAGRSDRSAYDLARYSSLDGYAQDVLQICADLGLEDVTLVGHSVSAMIGILASVAEPDDSATSSSSHRRPDTSTTCRRIAAASLAETSTVCWT